MVLVIMLSMPSRTLGWGNRGHQVIARIAMGKLSIGARQAIAEVLDSGETLESVSGWADEIKGSRAMTRSWHFVSIPLSDTRYLRSKDCGSDETCIIDAIAQQTVILKDTERDPTERAEALKYLVHLIGDLHQPFHVTTNTNPQDLAANRVRVTSLSGRSTNLHDVWDADLVESGLKQSARSVGDYATQLTKNFSQSPAGQTNRISTQGSATGWALEAHKLAWDAYKHPNGEFMVADKRSWTLDQQYYATNVKVVEVQLTRAGLRLAKILNDIFRAKSSYK